MRLKARKCLLCVIPLMHVILFVLYLSLHPATRANHSETNGILPISSDNSVMNTSQYLNRNPHAFIKSAAYSYTLKGSALKHIVIHSECINIEYPEILSLQESWNPTDKLKTSFVFSAYYDERDNGTIAIVGAKAGRESSFVCQSWKKSADGQSVTMVESVARATNMPESHGRRYSATLFTCRFDKKHIPETVSVVTNSCSTPLNLMKVRDTRPERNRRNFTVCVTPFNFRYGRAYELVEWIELNRILGADHFTFYNFSTAENVRRVLDYYSDLRLVEVVNWDLPMGVDTWPRTGQPVEIHYFAQLAFLNECWRRNRRHSEFVVNIDLDEFIIPRLPSVQTWQDLMATLPVAPAYVFQHVFFRKEWDDPKLEFPGIENASKYKLVTLLKTVRESYIHPHYMRSKYMVRTDSALVLGIHNIPRLQGKQYPTKVPFGKALLHHYRNWENVNDSKAKSIDTTVITKYKNDIIKRVSDVWAKLPDVELDTPLT